MNILLGVSKRASISFSASIIAHAITFFAIYQSNSKKVGARKPEKYVSIVF